ncbi:lipoprotein-releasing ABC transporter permease subunit [Solilutibacter silvestris]|uniref:lipoprotein-releasing ABC transporter permease subunit n=1 Tax=Solilutibacter silvestris TaxID=1645665 RepID=UPI003D32849E
MFKPLPIAIGLRYLRAKRRNGFISFISMASIIGIALGVAVLITTLSVMGGFQREIRDRLLQMAAHATVVADGREMTEWPRAIKLALADPRVAAASPYVDTQALIDSGNDKAPAIIRGVLPDQERKVSVIGDKMVTGSLDSLTPGSYNVLLGKELADILGVRLGDSVLVATSGMNITGMGAAPQMKRFVVSGVFEAGHQEFDKGLAIVRMGDLQRVQRMDGVTGVRLKLHDMDKAWDVARDLALRLGGGYRVNDWMHENANLFRAIRMERTLMAILLSLIIVMGAFNLVSSQVMLVTDKQADIAIQRTLGMTPGQVMRIFMVQGSLIGIIGTVIGVVGGILLTLNLEHILRLIERAFHVNLLPDDVYYITGLPIDLRASTIAIIAAVALAMAFLATLYPAWRASRTPPAEALRYE